MSIQSQIGNDGIAVTPHDTNALAKPALAFYVGGAGTVVLRTLRGNNLTFVGVNAGSTLAVGGTYVLATGTTASNIIAITE